MTEDSDNKEEKKPLKSGSLYSKWINLLNTLEDMVGKKPKDMNTMLFLIGVQELGVGPKVFSKEEKQDLMHIAICKLLSQDGYYELLGRDEQNWPHYEVVKVIPHKNMMEQTNLLQSMIVRYFEEQGIV